MIWRGPIIAGGRKYGLATSKLMWLLVSATPAAALAAPADLQLDSNFRLTSTVLPASSSLVAMGNPEDISSQSFSPVDRAGPLPDDASLPYGPADPAAAARSGDGEDSGATTGNRFRGFGSQAWAVKWEFGAVLAYYTGVNANKLDEDLTSFHVKKEGWFGKSTNNLGVDKLSHAYTGYVVSELLYARLKRKTGNAPGIAFTAAALGLATTLYTELWDSVEVSGGWSWEDVAMNSAGAAFSLLRNSVPGLDKKLDYRLMVMPDSHIFTASGKKHFEQQRYFFALKLSGFKALEQGPLRFLELHAGYYGKDFTLQDRARGIEPKRRLFVGVGINLRELLFKNSTSRIGRAAGEVLDYFQPPYTAVHRHVTN